MATVGQEHREHFRRSQLPLEEPPRAQQADEEVPALVDMYVCDCVRTSYTEEDEAEDDADGNDEAFVDLLFYMHANKIDCDTESRQKNRSEETKSAEPAKLQGVLIYMAGGFGSRRRAQESESD